LVELIINTLVLAENALSLELIRGGGESKRCICVDSASEDLKLLKVTKSAVCQTSAAPVNTFRTSP